MEQNHLIALNAEYNTLKGMGGWRSLYYGFIKEIKPSNLIEIGSGDPTFLSAIRKIPSVTEVVGIDGNENLSELYKRENICFYVVDLDNSNFKLENKKFDVAICSDVFEHLIFPKKTLLMIKDLLKENGILISHVPNEFSFRKIIKIMLGKENTVIFHKDADEWDNPHLRRFSNLGYIKFLQEVFQYNLKITDIRYKLFAKILKSLNIKVPLFLEMGPTYISTNDEVIANNIFEIKKKIERDYHLIKHTFRHYIDRFLSR